MKRDVWLLLLFPALLGACGPKEGSQASDSGSSSTSGVTSGTTSEAPTSGTTSQPTTEPMGSSTTFDELDCGHAEVHAPSVMLVLDKSGSMVAEPGGFWDHDQDPNTPAVTRWSSLHAAVSGFTVQFDMALNLGLVLFPSPEASPSDDETACIVDADAAAPIAGMNAANLLAALPDVLSDATIMKGATPATKGLDVAIQALTAVPIEQPRFIIFVTDGAANCQANAPDPTTLLEVYDDDVAATVAAAAAMGIKTLVVGIDVANVVSGSEVDGEPDSINNYEKLNELALAGDAARPGDEKFFNATDQVGLQAALDEVSRQILSCIIPLDPTPKYPKTVEVNGSREGLMVGPDEWQTPITDCMTEHGWMYLPEDPMMPGVVRIELCGAVCSDYRMSGEVDIQYRCPNST